MINKMANEFKHVWMKCPCGCNIAHRVRLGRAVTGVCYLRGHSKRPQGVSFHSLLGRWRITNRKHGKTTYYARAVMETDLGRELLSSELVHHINEDSADDRIENLQVMSRKEHNHLHKTLKENK